MNTNMQELARLANKIELRLYSEPAPVELVAAIAKADSMLKYSSARHLFHCIFLGLSQSTQHNFVGVFGDGNNGGYEWFIWEDGKLTHSDNGYGSTLVALFRGMQEAESRGWM